MTYSEWSIVSLSPWPQEYHPDLATPWVRFHLGSLQLSAKSNAVVITESRGLMLLAVGLLLTHLLYRPKRHSGCPLVFLF